MKMESHAAAAAAHHSDGHAHGSLRTYLVGFVLSVVLTAVPFWLVMSGAVFTTRTAFELVTLPPVLATTTV